MTKATCASLAPRLGAYVDGELTGADALMVAAHLEECARCAAQIEADRSVGESLREAAAVRTSYQEIAGLAGGVFSRLQAERSLSWRALFERAFEDWHWIVVGSGSVAATLIVTLGLSAVLTAGPAPNREDSLSAVMNNLGGSAGTLVVLGAPVGQERSSMLMVVGEQQVDAEPVAPTDLGFATEADLSRRLAELVTHDGRVVDQTTLSREHQQYAEDMLRSIRRMRVPEDGRNSSGPVVVQQIMLRASTSVSAKGL